MRGDVKVVLIVDYDRSIVELGVGLEPGLSGDADREMAQF